MTTERDLGRLFDAERGESASAGAEARGLARLDRAIAAGAQPMAVSLAPLSIGVSATLKWGAGAAALALLAGATALSQTPAEPPRALRASAVATAPGVAAGPVLETNAPATHVETPPTSTPSTPSTRPSSGSDAALTEELRLVKLAKGEIDAGRSHLAEVWLDEHARRFPNGVFRTERDALRILVACAGDTANGQRKALDFVRMNPSSPLVDRIARACRLTEEPLGESKVEK
jgi:hypothetical protein